MSKKPVEIFIDQNTKWVATGMTHGSDPDIPYATHEGTVELMGVTLRCARLSTGITVIQAEDMEKLLEVMGMELPK